MQIICFMTFHVECQAPFLGKIRKVFTCGLLIFVNSILKGLLPGSLQIFTLYLAAINDIAIDKDSIR